MRKISAKRQNEFAALIQELFDLFGFKKLEPGDKFYGWYTHKIEGPFGRYVAQVDCGDHIPTVFGRFVTPPFPAFANPYSGKWNHHYSSEDSMDYIRLDLVGKFARLASPSPIGKE